ncbi:MAG: CDP-alcohol phosphatidyltransferase family protein [bacterium]|nr:CDP-alcohol phosphatidyltransferase family protein [bacterium]
MVPRWLPNAITLLRIGAIPVFLAFARACAQAAAAGEPHADERVLAFATMVLIGVSDLVDGYLARRFGLATPLGAALDAAADKAAQISALAFFTFSRSPAFAPVPIWFFGVIAGRDLVMAAGWLAIRLRVGSVRVVHERHGKLASFLVFTLAVWIAADLPRAPLGPVLAITAALVCLSTVSYFRDGLRQVPRADRPAS